MLNGVIGKKLGMTHIFGPEGEQVPVTVLEAGPCTVVQIKDTGREGYTAVQIGFGEMTKRQRTKPLEGHFRKAGVAPTRVLRELRVHDAQGVSVGQVVGAELFEEGDFVDVTGISKGKGFAGVMKRHRFSGLPGSHGTHESFRGAGSIGASSDPSRVFRGKRMPGQMGAKRASVQNLRVVQVLKEQNLVLVKGAVPGSVGGTVLIRRSVKRASRAEGKANA